jgi:hypothetical protein
VKNLQILQFSIGALVILCVTISLFFLLPKRSAISTRTALLIEGAKLATLQQASINLREMPLQSELNIISLKKHCVKTLGMEESACEFRDPDSGIRYDWLLFRFGVKNSSNLDHIAFAAPRPVYLKGEKVRLVLFPNEGLLLITETDFIARVSKLQAMP